MPVLCRYCRVRARRDFPFCLKCGQPIKGASIELAVPSVLYPASAADGYAMTGLCTTIGRAADNDLVVDDKYVSRYHARIWREPSGYRLEDLDSLNSTFVNQQPLEGGGSVRLRDFDTLGIGPTQTVRIEQPRELEIGGKTLISPPEESLVIRPGAVSGPATPGDQEATVAGAPTGIAPDRSGGLDLRPRRRSGWELKQAPSQPGKLRYVLRNSRTGHYLQMTDRDVFLWNLMDGENTIRDLLLEYSREYGQLALTRIQQLVDQLAVIALVRGVGADSETADRGLGRRVYDRVVNALTRAELAVSGIDGLLRGVYGAGGWVFFTTPGLILVWGLAALGLFAFFIALGYQQPLEVGGAGLLGLVVAIIGYSLALMLHELAHALAVKSYGRKVPRGGFMLMMGMPYAFIDTTDMWFESRRARIVVTLAGPVVTLAVAAFFSFLALFDPSLVWSAIAFQVALGLYINTLFNFNPLIPLDGYYALSDWLEMPHLREEASAYFTRGIWGDIVHRRHIGRGQVGLLIYGAASVLAMLGFLALALLMWNTRIGDFTRSHVPPPFDTVILAVGLALLFFPVWYEPLTRALNAISRRRRPEVGHVEMESASVG